MYIGRSFHSEFLRPFAQILREMISPTPTMKVISVKVALPVVSDQGLSNTYS